MKRWILPFLLLCSESLFALSPEKKDSLKLFPSPEWQLGARSMLGMRGELSINSSGLTGAFYKPFVRGGHIDEGLKRSTIEGMEAVNRLGGDRILSLGGSFEPDTLLGRKNEERRFFFRLSNGVHYHSRFSRGLFRTVFMGNANTEGGLELAPFKGNLMRYRQLKAGLLDQKGKLELGIAIGFVQGRSDLRIRAEEAYLESREDGEELRMRANGEWRRIGEGGNFLGGSEGSGFTVDIMGGYDLGEYGRVRLSLNDLGLLHWNADAERIRVDTSFAFRGFRLQDPLGGGDIGTGAPVDSLRSTYATEETAPYRSFFPARISLTYSKRFPSGALFRTRFLHRPFTPHLPFVSIEGMKRWGFFHTGLSLGYGGYGEFAFGLALGASVTENWEVRLRAPHLEGLIFPQSMGGVAASAGIHYLF